MRDLGIDYELYNRVWGYSGIKPQIKNKLFEVTDSLSHLQIISKIIRI